MPFKLVKVQAYFNNNPVRIWNIQGRVHINYIDSQGFLVAVSYPINRTVESSTKKEAEQKVETQIKASYTDIKSLWFDLDTVEYIKVPDSWTDNNNLFD